MPGPIETVETFCAMWEQPGGFAASIREYFTEQTDYENVGMTHTIGIEQGLALVAGFENDMGIARIKVDMLAIAANLGFNRVGKHLAKLSCFLFVHSFLIRLIADHSALSAWEQLSASSASAQEKSSKKFCPKCLAA